MKQLLNFLLLIATLPLAAQYVGGAGDGYDLAVAATDLQPLVQFPERFGGGPGDGYDRQGAQSVLQPLTLFSERYGGGSGDGYDQQEAKSLLQPLTQFSERYGGGSGDGYDQQEAKSLLQPLILFSERYGGGSGDGYDSELGANFELPLPLTLLDFTATPRQKSVLLQWTTIDESDTDHFTVERTTDETHFTRVGTLPAAGNAVPGTSLAYELYDDDPRTGVSFYRLRMQDLDGSYSYSDLRQVAFSGQGSGERQVSISPNPTDGIVNIFIDNVDGGYGQVSITLHDGTGRKLTGYQLQLEPTPRLDVRHLPAGMYFLRVSSPGGLQETLRVVRR